MNDLQARMDQVRQNVLDAVADLIAKGAEFKLPAPPGALAVCCQRLARDYPLSHKVILYRAATLPIDAPHILRIALGKLADADIDAADTLVIPPARKLDPDAKTLGRLARLDKAET